MASVLSFRLWDRPDRRTSPFDFSVAADRYENVAPDMGLTYRTTIFGS